MKRVVAVGVVTLACIAAGVGVWWMSRLPAEAADAAPEAPVAQVRSEMPRVRSVAETLAAVGEVTAGQAIGLSFPRAGQVSALSVVVGDAVAKGAVLASLTPDPAVVQAWQAAVDGAGLAQREWDRQKQLMASHLATQSQVDSAEKTWRDAQGAVKALDAQGGGRGISELVAPLGGVVTAVSAAQGDRVQAGAPVLQIGRADPVRVLIGVEPSDSARVHAGMRVTLWPGADAAPLEAIVNEVRRVVDPHTQLVDVVAQLANGAAARLVAGMKVRAQLQLGTLSGVAVARNAVLTDERGDYVFQVAAGKARRVAVTRTFDDGTLAVIGGVADLKLPVVVEGNYELQDGMAVRDAAP